MGAYVGINDTARKITDGYIGIDGVARRLFKGYVGDGNGVARLIWSCTDPMPDFLIDFEGYITGTEESPTYTLARWKGTLNGEPSTEIVIPDRDCIIL